MFKASNKKKQKINRFTIPIQQKNIIWYCLLLKKKKNPSKYWLRRYTVYFVFWRSKVYCKRTNVTHVFPYVTEGIWCSLNVSKSSRSVMLRPPFLMDFARKSNASQRLRTWFPLSKRAQPHFNFETFPTANTVLSFENRNCSTVYSVHHE